MVFMLGSHTLIADGIPIRPLRGSRPMWRGGAGNSQGDFVLVLRRYTGEIPVCLFACARPVTGSEVPASSQNCPLARSVNMPKPARTELLPSPFGSHAIPSRGTML